MLTHYVKARVKGGKRFLFVTPKLGLNRLRIHAAMFTADQAMASAEAWSVQDDRYEFRAVPISRKCVRCLTSPV